jgi:hypothetical protein
MDLRYLTPFFILLLMINGVSQHRTEERIAPNKTFEKTVYLTFERFGSRKPLKTSESSEGIWLRLHNRSKTGVGVPVFLYEKIRIDGRSEIQIVPVYQVICNKPDDSCSAAPRGIDRSYTGNSFISSIEMKPGHSWLVSLPKNHLSEGLQICIDVISWDKRKSETSDREKHERVCFRNDELPSNVRQ